MRNIKTKQELDDIHATTRFQEFFFSVPEDESLEAFCSPLIDTANFNNIVKKEALFKKQKLRKKANKNLFIA